jgi:hypothetical protein
MAFLDPFRVVIPFLFLPTTILKPSSSILVLMIDVRGFVISFIDGERRLYIYIHILQIVQATPYLINSTYLQMRDLSDLVYPLTVISTCSFRRLSLKLHSNTKAATRSSCS